VRQPGAGLAAERNDDFRLIAALDREARRGEFELGGRLADVDFIVAGRQLMLAGAEHKRAVGFAVLERDAARRREQHRHLGIVDFNDELAALGANVHDAGQRGDERHRGRDPCDPRQPRLAAAALRCNRDRGKFLADSGQPRRHDPGRRRTPCRVLGQKLQDQVAQFGGHFGVEVTRRRRRCNRPAGSLRRKRRPPRRHAIEHAPESEQIAAFVGDSAGELLRRQKRRRAGDDAGLRQCQRVVNATGQAEIKQLE
jgi:hypothetical protein